MHNSTMSANGTRVIIHRGMTVMVYTLLVFQVVQLFAASPDDTAATSADTGFISDTDSLRREIVRLKEEAETLRSKAEEITDSIDQIDEEPREAHSIDENDTLSVVIPRSRKKFEKDTILFLAREGTQAFLKTIRGRKRGARERGYGGGIGPTPSIHAVSVSKINDALSQLSSRKEEFSSITFPLNHQFESFFMMGLVGYGALGNGLRIGGGFSTGSKSPSSVQLNDAMYSLEIKTTFGGLSVEKAFVKGDANWFIGGMFGGSDIELNIYKTLYSDEDREDYSDGEPFSKFNAPCALLELHGGLTYTMVNWFHIGIEISTPLFFSTSGFKSPTDWSLTDGFVSVNPGIRFRIILGNIG